MQIHSDFAQYRRIADAQDEPFAKVLIRKSRIEMVMITIPFLVFVGFVSLFSTLAYSEAQLKQQALENQENVSWAR